MFSTQSSFYKLSKNRLKTQEEKLGVYNHKESKEIEREEKRGEEKKRRRGEKWIILKGPIVLNLRTETDTDESTIKGLDNRDRVYRDHSTSG